MDYSFRLVERGGGNISLLEYKEWRKRGMAYVFDDDQSASQPNMSLASSVRKIGKEMEKSSERGFYGDIVTGPFISYGLDPSYTALPTEETKIKRTSQELSLERINALVESISKKIKSNDNPEAIELIFLPLSAERDIKRSSREFENKFDVSFIACSVAHLFTTDFEKNMLSGGLIIMETPLFLLHMAPEIQEKFKEHLLNITKSTASGLTLMNDNYEVLKTTTTRIKKQ